jgi:hypothetical protein
MKREDTFVRVSVETKALLNVLKKRTSADAYIQSMLNYFTATGIDPRDRIVDRTDRILKRFEDVIKLIRAIEKGRIMKIEDKTDQLFEHIFGTSVIERMQEEPIAMTDQVSLDELQEVVSINQSLKQQLEDAHRSLENERKEKEMYKFKVVNSDAAYSTSLIKEAISKIQEISKPAVLDNSRFLVEKMGMHELRKILEELLVKNKN